VGMHALHGAHNIYAGARDVEPGLPTRSTPAVLLGNALFLQGILTPVFGTNIPLWSLSFEFW
jgi:hypothetical protein